MATKVKSSDQPPAQAVPRVDGEKYRALFDASPAAFLVLAPDLKIVAVNDAYLRATMTERSDLLGRHVFEAFPDDPDEPQADGVRSLRASLQRVLANRCADALPLLRYPIRRPAAEGSGFEERWWSPLNTPVLGPDGKVMLIIHYAEDVTGTVRLRAGRDRLDRDEKAFDQRLRESEQRQRFLLELGDRMRDEEDPDAVINVALRLLGEWLGASRVVYVEIDEAAGLASTRQGWTAEGGEVHPGTLRLEAFGGPLLDQLRAGRTVRCDDVGSAPHDREDLAALDAMGVKAGISVPLIVDGHLVADLNVHQYRPRAWTDAEVELAEEVTERTWGVVRRTRAELALRRSEEKYRTLFETMGQGYCEIELVRDADGRAVDQRYLELNPAYERLIGIPVASARGRMASEVMPGLESWWTESFDRIVRRGGPERIEHEIASLGRWFEVFVHPRGGDRISVLYGDITGRRQLDLELRGSEERKSFLLKLSDGLRSISDAVAIQEQASRLLGEHLRVNRVAYAEIEGGDLVVRRDYNDGVESMAGRYPKTAFGQKVENAFSTTGTIWEDDIPSSTRFSEAEQQVYRATRIAAFIGVTLFKEGHISAAIGVHSATPRAWTPDEILLTEDVAERIWAAVQRARAEGEVREHERRQRLLIGELNHRVKNTLAVVQSIAIQTLNGAEDLRAARDHLESRLVALARAHDILTEGHWSGGELREVVAAALRMHAQEGSGERVRWHGPDVSVKPKAVLALSMALHELATNSVKYGALSSPAGRVEVAWAIPQDRPLRFHMRWTERDGPPVTPPEHRGFGSRLIERGLGHDLNGHVHLDFAHAGLVCTIEAPLQEITPADDRIS